MTESIIIIDFGSQVTKLIARRIREFGVFSQIVPFDKVTRKLLSNNSVKGIILSGGPKSVHEKNSPKIDDYIYELEIPILGICYGLQLIAKQFGGKIIPSTDREFGKTKIKLTKKSPLLENVLFPNKPVQVWMSHSDKISVIPDSFEKIASSDNCEFAAIQNQKKKIYCVQFHPEVIHTIGGKKILKNFIRNICVCSAKWNMKFFKKKIIEDIKMQVGKDKVICGLSGGVDSTVTATLIHKAIKNNLVCVFVDTGFMRSGERKQIQELFNKNFQIKLKVIDSSKIFFEKLKGVKDPEIKRKIIGKEFIKIFENFALQQKNIKYLAQGTLYPDVIESKSKIGNTNVIIKSHHNVGGLPKKMKLKLLEPLKELFKDEVRELGRKLNIPKTFTNRHPFPGPGLAIRLLGEVNQKDISILRNADKIFIQLIKDEGLYDEIWQAFCVLLPVKTVGVMGDKRTYEKICILRAVTSLDGMTAEAYKFKNHFLEKCASEIVNKVPGINRVCYDYTSKPPGTIEYE